MLLLTEDKLARRRLAARCDRRVLFTSGATCRTTTSAKGAAYLARTERLDRIVALDDFDVETAAMLREYLHVPGMGETTARGFRDKLAMRSRARAAGDPLSRVRPRAERRRGCRVDRVACRRRGC